MLPKKMFVFFQLFKFQRCSMKFQSRFYLNLGYTQLLALRSTASNTAGLIAGALGLEPVNPKNNKKASENFANAIVKLSTKSFGPGLGTARKKIALKISNFYNLNGNKLRAELAKLTRTMKKLNVKRNFILMLLLMS